MKKIKLVLLLMALHLVPYAQNTDAIKNIDDFYLDLSVPDLSAFQMLNVNPTQVLKPSSVKEFAAGFSGLDSGGKIKPGFALSWSPFQTFNKSATSVDDYRKNYYWKYAFQFTSATNTDSTGSNLAFGFNWVPVDKSNIIKYSDAASLMANIINRYSENEDNTFKVTHDPFFSSLYKKKFPNTDAITTAQKIESIETALIPGNPAEIFKGDEAKRTEKNIIDEIIKMLKNIGIEQSTLNTDEKAHIQIIVKSYLMQKEENAKAKVDADKAIKLFKEDFQKNHWNATRLQISSGIVLNSGDGTWNNLKGRKWVSFTSSNIGFGNWGQLIGMIEYTDYFKSDTLYNSKIFAGARFLVGNSNLQFSLEGGYNSYKGIESSNDYRVFRTTLGAEVKVTDGIWFEFATGLNKVTKGQEKISPIALGTFKYAFQKKSRFSIQ